MAIKAPVVPRARRSGSTIPLRLDQHVLPYVQSRACGVIYIIAPAGAGKTLALNHLRAVLPADANVAFFDNPQFDHWMNVVDQKLAIVTTTKSLAMAPLEQFELAAWTDDDCCEYLASTHRQHCASVMKRLVNDPLYPLLAGSPEHLREVMDEMAADPGMERIGDALRSTVRGRARNEKSYALLLRLSDPLVRERAGPGPFLECGFSERLARFCAQPATRMALACEQQVCLLERGLPAACLEALRDRVEIQEVAAICRSRPDAVRTIDHTIGCTPGGPVGGAASIRLLIDPGWRPEQGKCLDLSDAVLRKAQWSALDLSHTRLQGAVLVLANLSRAVLRNVNAHRANCAGSIMSDANLSDARFSCANFDGANLSRVDASAAFFNAATFRAANLTSAVLNQVTFSSACLEGANLSAAQLIGAHFFRTFMDEATFDHANLTGARFKEVNLSGASWAGAIFDTAAIRFCTLDGMELPQGRFNEVDFKGSTLTGTRIPGGQFHRAFFGQAGLADIDWPDADLRDADFTNATFHMGSSRSGLVGSVIPCEGSKMGFYTDDYHEQDFKAPEEIRKANLCGADLRGAKVTGTDWYLVDLRGAHYTADQEDHFARCGAILHSRVID